MEWRDELLAETQNYLIQIIIKLTKSWESLDSSTKTLFKNTLNPEAILNNLWETLNNTLPDYQKCECNATRKEFIKEWRLMNGKN